MTKAHAGSTSDRIFGKVFLRFIWPVFFLLTLALSGCSSTPAEKEPVVSVQAASVEKITIHLTSTAEAVLFPLQQSAIIPKITAPVKEFYVTRGVHVHRGQLLATLENKDLA